MKMKTTTKIFMSAIFSAALLFASCKKEDDKTIKPGTPSIIGTWNFDGGTFHGSILSKNSPVNTFNFRSDNKLERKLDLEYSTGCPDRSCTGFILPYKYNDTTSYVMSASDVTFDGGTWQSTITNSTLILKKGGIDSLHFSR